MKTKIFAIMLALMLVLLCVVSCGGSGDGAKETDNGANTGAIVGDDTNPPPVTGGIMKVEGEIADGVLTVKVTVVNNPGIAGFNLKLNFDKTKLCPAALLDSDITIGDAYTSNLQQGPEFAAKLDHVSAQYAQAGNYSEDGVLVVATFDILEGATGETSITLDASDVTDEELNDMEFTVENLTINLG